ncbi:serine/threonine protein phosphatase [Acinetobacter baumannii]
MQPYGIQSDSHCHNWHAFSSILESGINNRLQHILDEKIRLANEVKKVGGNTIYHTGDLFHVRGNIAPSVLNPTLDTYRHIVKEMGMKVRILAGNHDLEGRDAHRVSSAITALEGIGCEIVNAPTAFYDDQVIMLPWHQNTDDLKKAIADMVKGLAEHEDECARINDIHNWDLMIHAPVDGVIPGLPAHGLTDKELVDFGFKRVFCGHYHHHKDFGNGVYSVGASTHQTWSDVGSKAGFLIVDSLDVKWYRSHAPEFVEINGDMDELEMKAVVDGAYVRAKINSDKAADVEAVRNFLLESGAKGVTILTTKVAIEASRSTSTVKAGASIEASVGEFIKSSPGVTDAEALTKLCNSILVEARMEVAE